MEILTRTPRTLEGKPSSVRIPHLSRFVGTEVVDRPWGYVVPPAVLPLLGRHGIPVHTLDRATFKRTPKPSALLYRDIVRANAV